MTPTTEFATEGLLRQLMPSAVGTIAFIVFILVIMFIVSRVGARAKSKELAPGADVAETMDWVKWGGRLVILLALLGFGWNAVTVTTLNRAPRADLDGSAVYQQMQNNITTPSE